MSRVPGVRQVAALAGVSRGTVSNVLNHPHRVDAETLKRVHEAIETLGYVPNTLARALSTGTNTMAGLILPGLHTSIFVNMARNAQVAAHRIGLNLLIADSEAVPARQIEHLGAERGHQYRRIGTGRKVLVNAVEVSPHGGHGLVVAMATQALDHRDMAYA